MRFAFITLLIVCLGAGCGQQLTESYSEPPSSNSSNRQAVPLERLPPGVHPQIIVRNDGTQLRFTVSIPDTDFDQTASPLVVALHYGGEVTPFYGRGLIDGLIGPALEELNAIIVAPDSIAGKWTNPTNEAAVMQIVDSVMASYNVDRSQVLLTGFSMGGEGTWYLGGRHQDLFSAAIPIAGLPGRDVDWRIPLYVIHAREDEVLPLEPTQRRVDELQSTGADIELVVVDGIAHYETARFGDPLKNAIPWIRQVWNSTPHR